MFFMMKTSLRPAEVVRVKKMGLATTTSIMGA